MVWVKMEFTWDESKRRQNLEKHGIVFSQPMLVRKDMRRDYHEERWAALGKLKDLVIFIAYTLRGETFRIISIRRANKRERQIYEKAFPD